jgi:methane monooxygenase PmoA-like
MTKVLIPLFFLLMLFYRGAATQAPVTFKERDNKIEIEINGKAFSTFHYGKDWAKPFLHPLRASSGTIVTRGFPLEKIEGESNDHFWQRGLWFAHGDINGIDFWREASGDKAKDAKLPLPVGLIAIKSAPKYKSERGNGKISAVFNLVAPGDKILGTLSQEYIFRSLDKNIIIDLKAVVLADQGISLKMGDTEEGLLGFRFADEFKEDRGAALSNSEGLKGTDNIWGKRARWVDYSTSIKGEKLGVAILDHPQNPKHPTYWHARGYGLNAANPFGEHDFRNDKSLDGSVTIPAGGNLSFYYRVVIHPGDAQGIEQLYTAFAHEGSQ